MSSNFDVQNILKAVKENNLTGLKELLKGSLSQFHNPLMLIQMSIKRNQKEMTDFLLDNAPPQLDLTNAVETAVKRKNLTLLQRLLKDPSRITSVSNAIHLARYQRPLLILLIRFQEKNLSDLNRFLPTWALERLIQKSLWEGDATLFWSSKDQIKNTDVMLTFLLRLGLKDEFNELLRTASVRNPKQVFCYPDLGSEGSYQKIGKALDEIISDVIEGTQDQPYLCFFKAKEQGFPQDTLEILMKKGEGLLRRAVKTSSDPTTIRQRIAMCTDLVRILQPISP